MSSHGKPYSLYHRNRIYYCRFKLPDNRWSPGKSTGETAKGRAERWAIDYLSAGQIVRKENVTLAEFSKDFFAWDGKWAIDKRTTGRRLGQAHCKNRAELLNNHIIPIFGNIKLTALNETIIEGFRNNIYNSGYSGSTTNKILITLNTILKAAKKQKLIQYVPEVELAADRPKHKGILTIEEVKRLFSIEWKSDPAHCNPSKENFIGYAGNLLASVSGLRMSEIRALVISDAHLDEGFIYVHRSWDRLFGFNQTTKTGHARNIFIPDIVKNVLQKLIEKNPEPNNPNSFLFFSKKIPCKPVEPIIFTRSLYTAMRSIGISENERQQRNITFHSWRHWFNSLLINAKIPLQKIQSMTGHLTAEMTQHYYHLDDMQDVRQIQESIFTGNPIQGEVIN